MIKFFKNRKFFRIYKKTILENKEYLFEKYGLEINFWYELYATINLTDAPDELKQKYGSSLAEYEIKKYIKSFDNDIIKLELDELIKRTEIKKIDNDNYGIAFGFSLLPNKKLIIQNIVISALTVLTILGIILI